MKTTRHETRTFTQIRVKGHVHLCNAAEMNRT